MIEVAERVTPSARTKRAESKPCGWDFPKIGSAAIARACADDPAKNVKEGP